LRGLFDRFLFRLGALDLPSGTQALVAQNGQGSHLGALTPARGVFEDFEVARTGFSLRVDLTRGVFFGFFAPEHKQFANVLNGRGVQLIGQALQHGFSGNTVIPVNPHFDQTVCIQGEVDFFDDGFAQALGSNHDDGVEVVGEGAMFFANGGGEDDCRHRGYYPSLTRENALKIKTKSKKVNKAWLNDHANDTYVKLAKKEGYRARAAYKLKEIDEQLKLIKPGDLVVDLGSAPGAWSQYVRRKLSPDGAAVGELNGVILALDILPMEPIEGVQFIQGDFREPDVASLLSEAMSGRLADVVVSDMAPNLSGIESADAARIAHLIELALEFSQAHMKPEGALVVKVFHGSGYSQLVKLFKDHFVRVKPLKPKASRDKSSETFLIGLGLKPSMLTGMNSTENNDLPPKTPS